MRTSAHHITSAHAPPRYGDFPELFWDLQPDEVVDVEQPWVIARFLTQATPELIGQMVPVETIRRELPTLPVPEHTRRFWEMVLGAFDRKQASTAGEAGARR